MWAGESKLISLTNSINSQSSLKCTALVILCNKGNASPRFNKLILQVLTKIVSSFLIRFSILVALNPTKLSLTNNAILDQQD